ncbi:hypothetical protein PGT21_002808 [Puccinia graminis f. sp. tritici]|uniref:Uncharacterized protein n=1 Tax=Puccinia graminis f. sp. tritici TaxID=56615 RepID=A0A5B0MLX5_PUCGR|nr:hypothetical protein PGT21_002808 [Puccinia graminis f. sp. tritici]
MVVRRLPGGPDLGTSTGSNSSAPASGQSASYQSTGTPSTTTSLTSAPSAQATGTATPPSASSSIASTVTSNFSQVPTASPTPVTTQTTDLSASPTPTNVPEQTITASAEGVAESAPLPSSSLTEFSPPISSAPVPNASAAQQSPGQTSEFTGTIITAVCFGYFTILFATVVAVYILRRRRHQEVDHRTSRKISKWRSQSKKLNQSFDFGESVYNPQTPSLRVTTPFTWGDCSTKNLIISDLRVNRHNMTPHTNSLSMTHSNSASMFSARSSASTTNTVLDPFMRYKYPRRQSLASRLPQSPSTAYSRPEGSKYSSLSSAFTSFICRKSHFNGGSSYWSSEDAKSREKFELRNCRLRSPSRCSSFSGRSSNTVAAEGPSYRRTSRYGSDRKSDLLIETETRQSGITSLLENYAYDDSGPPQYPSSAGVLKKSRNSIEKAARSSLGMTLVFSDTASQMQSSYSPGQDLCMLGLDFGDGMPDEQSPSICSPGLKSSYLLEESRFKKGR